ncbi:MAG: ATP synthase subunit I [Steroidobacteraceae bacterium]|jgi:F0F1-type ATP synthase assembly protein I
MVRGRTTTMRARHDPELRGKRLALRFAAVQLGGALLTAIIVAVITDGSNAMATLAGGAVVAVGNLVFGWRLFAPGVAPAERIAKAMWVGEGLKWLWVVVAVWLALDVSDLAPLPFLLGMLAGQVGFWVGVAVIKEDK